MSAETWGMLPKSQEDNETIEEAIDRVVGEHNANEEAHQAAGGSLNLHKSDSVIDHPAGSVVEDKVANSQIIVDKLSFDRFILHSHFESLDCWDKTAGVSLIALSQVRLSTGSVINTVRRMFAAACDDNDEAGAPLANPEFQTTVNFGQITDQIIYIGQCEPAEPFGWGFKIVDDVLFAFWTDDSSNEYTEAISGVALRDWIVLRCVFIGGSSIKFYVDGVLKYTASSNLPTMKASVFIMYSIENTAASDKHFGVQDVVYIQDFFK